MDVLLSTKPEFARKILEWDEEIRVPPDISKAKRRPLANFHVCVCAREKDRRVFHGETNCPRETKQIVGTLPRRRRHQKRLFFPILCRKRKRECHRSRCSGNIFEPNRPARRVIARLPPATVILLPNANYTDRILNEI